MTGVQAGQASLRHWRVLVKLGDAQTARAWVTAADRTRAEQLAGDAVIGAYAAMTGGGPVSAEIFRVSDITPPRPSGPPPRDGVWGIEILRLP